METINDHLYKARRALILGTTGTGKTELCCRLIDLHPAELVLVYDWQGGEICKRVGGALAQSRADVGRLINAGERVVCYDAESGEADPERAGFEWFCEMVYEVSGKLPGRKLMVADEVQALIDPRNIPVPLKVVLVRGRRKLIDTILMGCMANALNNLSRDQVSELYCFRNIDDLALEYPGSLGIDKEEVRALDDGEFISLNTRTGEKVKLDLWD